MHTPGKKTKKEISVPVNILFVGVGGQGIVLASDITARAAMYAGFDVKKSEIHGMSQRGGSVFSHVRFGVKVYSPMIPAGAADILVSFEEMETLRWLEFAGKKTRVIVCATRILPAGATAYPEGAREFLNKNFDKVNFLDTSGIAGTTGMKFVNVAVLGFVSRFLSLDPRAFEKAIAAGVPAGTGENNIAAFNFGRKEVSS